MNHRIASVLGVVLAFLVLTASSAARADVVPEPPPSCPAGGTPETCHGGPHCQVVPCDATHACGGGQVCKEVEGCFRKLNCAGDVNPEDLPRYDRWSLDSPCDPNRICCTKLAICVPPTPPEPTPPTPDPGAASSTPAPPATTRSACAGASADMALLLPALGLLLARRRSARA